MKKLFKVIFTDGKQEYDVQFFGTKQTINKIAKEWALKNMVGSDLKIKKIVKGDMKK